MVNRRCWQKIIDDTLDALLNGLQHWYIPLFRSEFVSTIQLYSNFAIALPVSLPG
ncbi:hypothetical protein [Nostoc sp. 'Lobaria pulmonaria (5183) cyanobiont']|uniref:hypothetical protein n=1 Tax=Nostoc sp. 'Lobaria pulmonaria (5183) cyanobiont' TaxID=1618022 RepID=UPI001319F71B|nr:hypothetical protein [Nostoc sp. 'Lobaria pulmonaria (5183) cyanobiont']